MSVPRVLVRLARGLMVPFLALWLLTPFSPLNLMASLAPVSTARAASIDDLGKCLDAATTAAGMSLTVVDAAAKIAEAAADPKYVACMSAAGAGDLVTIGFMVAVTAFYANGDLGDIQNPEQCVEAIKSKVMDKIASTLNDLLTGGGLGQSLLESLLPDAAVGFIQDIVKDATSDAAKAAVEALWDVLGIVTSKIECGCAAAGTAAIIKKAYDDLKAKVDEFKDGAEGCLDILKDPFGFLESALTNPGKTLKVIGEAACNGIKKTGVDLCGAFAEAGGFLLGVLEHYAEAVWGGVQEVGCFLTAGLWGCDEKPTPPPPPPTCGTTPENANKVSDACVCPAGMGTKAFKVANGCNSSIPYEQMNAADKYSCSLNMTYIDKKYCAPCDQYSVLNDFGSCQTCPAGLLPGTDGKCSKPVVCNKAAGEFVGTDGHTCSTCPDGTTLGKNGKCNANPAVCAAWPWLKPQSGKAPSKGILFAGQEPQVLGLNDPGNGDASWCACPAGLVNNGSACVKPDPVSTKPCVLNWQDRDPMTGICKDRCTPDQFYGPKPTNLEVNPDVCQPCPAGQLSYQNICVERCAVDEKRSALGSCLACAANMKAGGKKNSKGEYTQCVFACAAGQSYIDGVCTAACKSDQIRVEVGFGTGTPTPSCISCPAGTRAAGDKNGVGENTACVNDCPAGTAYQTTDVNTGAMSFGGNKAGGVSGTFAACMTCPAGTYPQTTKKTAFNATVETTVCAACPKTTTSDAGDASCHSLGIVTVSLPPGAKIPPVNRKVIDTPAYHPPTANTGNRPARQERAAPPTPPKPQASPARIQCGPGKVPNKAGTRCIVDLDADDDRPGGGGGSTAPAGRGGRGTTGSGGFTNFNRN